MANINIEDETDDYLKIGGLLYSWITLKDLPDATFPGILRELVLLDFPLVVNAEVTLARPGQNGQALQEPAAEDDGGAARHPRRVPHQRRRAGC